MSTNPHKPASAALADLVSARRVYIASIEALLASEKAILRSELNARFEDSWLSREMALHMEAASAYTQVQAQATQAARLAVQFADTLVVVLSGEEQ